MRKLNVGLLVACVVLVGLNIFQFVFWKHTNAESAEKYVAEIANLNATIAGYGDAVTVWTVTDAVKPGDEITEDKLQSLTMYTSLLTEQYVQDTSDIIGKYFKISVNPGTPIFYDSIMDEELDDTRRDIDIVLDRMPVGTAVGDYIDIRITMPYGDDYVVIPHKRVYQINEGSIKLHLTELEWNTYLGALVDYYLNQQYGCTIYADKYVEPGLQQAAVNYYAVPSNIAALLQKNPNIIDKDKAASLNDWRQSLDSLLVIFRDEEDTVDSDGGTLAGGRAAFNEAVESDRQAANEAANEESLQAAEDASGMEEVGDDFWDEEPAETPADVSDQVDEAIEDTADMTQEVTQ